MSESSWKTTLEIEYESESDTLWLGNGRPGSIGFDITRGVLIPFFDTDGVNPNSRIPIGLMLSPAAKLLAPHLPIEAIAHAAPVTYLDRLDIEIKYDSGDDVLWMGNGKQTGSTAPIVENTVVLYFEDGSEKRSKRGIQTPAGVMVYNAVKHIEPAILAELAELAAAGGTD